MHEHAKLFLVEQTAEDSTDATAFLKGIGWKVCRGFWVILKEIWRFNGSYEDRYYDPKPPIYTGFLNSNGPVV